MLILFTLSKTASTTQVKKHYKTLIILLVGAKCLKIMISSQLDLKRILKNQKSEGEAHFCMVNLRLARGISRIPMFFFMKFGRPEGHNQHFLEFCMQGVDCNIPAARSNILASIQLFYCLMCCFLQGLWDL